MEISVHGMWVKFTQNISKKRGSAVFVKWRHFFLFCFLRFINQVWLLYKTNFHNILNNTSDSTEYQAKRCPLKIHFGKQGFFSFFATSQKSAPHKVNESTVIHSATIVKITIVHTQPQWFLGVPLEPAHQIERSGMIASVTSLSLTWVPKIFFKGSTL